MSISLFGLEITKLKKANDLSAALTPPINDEGAQDTAPSLGSLYYGVYLDSSGSASSEFNAIQTYRQIAQYPEIDIAIQDIVNEAIPHESDVSSNQVDLIFNEDTACSDELKEAINEEFKHVLDMLNFGNMSSDIFRQWYIDGRLVYQVIVDKSNLSDGIVELRPIDALKIRKVREVEKVKTPSGVDSIGKITEYFVYSEQGFVSNNQQQKMSGQLSNTTGVKISSDAIIFVPSGITDVNGYTVISNLQKAIRPINQLRMMEDAMVVTRIARAPERRIFYIDVGALPKAKAEQYVKDIMNQYRNKMVYDSATGSIRDDKKYMSMLEDFWLPRRDGGKGTEISTLPGAQNLDQITDTTYFKEKVYQALNIPVSRLQGEEGFSLGRSTEISRDELKFQKFIQKQRRKFSKLFVDTLKTQLLLKGICNDIEWEELRQDITFEFQSDNAFAELKSLELLQNRLMSLQQADQYLGKYFSKEWVQKNILFMTDEQIEEMESQIDGEKGDPTAQPTIPGMPPGMDPSMMGGMGGDPNAMGGQPQGQFGQPQQGQQQDPYGM
jgi:hypothetical protein